MFVQEPLSIWERKKVTMSLVYHSGHPNLDWIVEILCLSLYMNNSSRVLVMQDLYTTNFVFPEWNHTWMRVSYSSTSVILATWIWNLPLQ